MPREPRPPFSLAERTFVLQYLAGAFPSLDHGGLGLADAAVTPCADGVGLETVARHGGRG